MIYNVLLPANFYPGPVSETNLNGALALNIHTYVFLGLSFHCRDTSHTTGKNLRMRRATLTAGPRDNIGHLGRLNMELRVAWVLARRSAALL